MKNKINWLQLDNWNYWVWVFDFDWNILAPRSMFYFKSKNTWEIIAVSEWDSWNYFNDKYEFLVDGDIDSVFNSFRDFTDVYTDSHIRHFHRWPDGLITDIETAFDEDRISPSLDILKNKFLTKWRLVSILTARWHTQDNLERWLKFINNEILSKDELKDQAENIRENYWVKSKDIKRILDYYFSQIVHYMPCSNKNFCKTMNIEQDANPARKKAIAMNHYIPSAHRIIENNIWKSINEILTKKNNLAIWFSDDSKSNIIEMYKNFAYRISKNDFYDNHKIKLYFTWDKSKFDWIKEDILWLEFDWVKTKFKKQNDKLSIKIT